MVQFQQRSFYNTFDGSEEQALDQEAARNYAHRQQELTYNIQMLAEIPALRGNKVWIHIEKELTNIYSKLNTALINGDNSVFKDDEIRGYMKGIQAVFNSVLLIEKRGEDAKIELNAQNINK